MTPAPAAPTRLYSSKPAADDPVFPRLRRSVAERVLDTLERAWPDDDGETDEAIEQFRRALGKER